MKSRRYLLYTIALLPVMAVALIVYGENSIPQARFKGTLKDLLPEAAAGWKRAEQPIADTPELKQAVNELLNYDDGVFYNYTSPAGKRLSVYIAYWSPGRMSPRLIASHTPDVCWVANGWKQLHADTVQPSTENPKRLIPQTQNRTFSNQGKLEYVWFWHVVGTRLQNYGTSSNPPWYSVFSDIWEQGINQRQEQFFIRLSSDRPLDEWRDESVFVKLLNALPLPE